jgi:amino acid permease
MPAFQFSQDNFYFTALKIMVEFFFLCSLIAYVYIFAWIKPRRWVCSSQLSNYLNGIFFPIIWQLHLLIWQIWCRRTLKILDAAPTRQVANFSDDPRKKKNSYKIFHVHNYWKKYNQRLTITKRKKEKDVNQRKKTSVHY